MREVREWDNDALEPLCEWFKSSKEFEYTKYYSFLVFHTPLGFYCCYANNTENFWDI